MRFVCDTSLRWTNAKWTQVTFHSAFPQQQQKGQPWQYLEGHLQKRALCLGGGWSEHEKGSFSKVQASGQSAGNYRGRAGTWGRSLAARVPTLPVCNGRCRRAVAGAPPFPVTPGSSLEGRSMQTLGGRASLLPPPPKTVRYIPKPSRNDV